MDQLNKKFNPKNKIKEFLLLILGLCICSYFFYIRFILKRLPTEIIFKYDILKFCIYFGLFLLFLYILIKKIYPKESKNKYIILIKEKLLLKILNFYTESLDKVSRFFILDHGISDIILYIICSSICEFFYMDFTKKPYFREILFYFITLLPNLLVTITLFIDVVIFNKYYYLYKIIWVLIIPLFYNIIYYIINKYDKKAWCFITTYFEGNFIIGETNIIPNYTRKVFPPKIAKFALDEGQYKFLEENLFVFFNLHLLLRQFESFTSLLIYKYLQIFIIIMSLITFGYLAYNYAIYLFI